MKYNRDIQTLIAVISIAILSKELAKTTGKSQDEIQTETNVKAVKILNTYDEKMLQKFMDTNFITNSKKAST